MRNQSATPRLPGFDLIREIGRGGMGVVYEARQRTPERRVAIKLLRSPLDGPDRVRRFEIEANALARVQHPNIATIYQTGVIDSDLGPCPYLAMEFVDGRPITEYADAVALSRPERVELLATVADAVHHAHTRGVIHRDLKPQNVLVDQALGVRVVDFGLARIAGEGPGEQTRHTTDGEMLGTVPYMSPEQLATSGADASTSSDVYALGVLLYELLTGRVPLGLDECSLAEAARRVRDETPVPLGCIDRELRGDLEHIAAMAIHRDPARRYASARAFAEDLRRHLHAQPLAARPPTMSDLVARFARRHKARAAGIAIGLAGLLVAVAVLAVSRHNAVADRTRLAAQVETTDDVIRFLTEDVLGAADPESMAPAGTTMRTVLDQASDTVNAGRFDDRPMVERAIRSTIGRTYMSLTEYDAALVHLQRAHDLSLAHETDANTHVETANDLAMLHMDIGDPDAADAVLAPAVDLLPRLDDIEQVIGTLNTLGAVRYRQDRFDDAAAALERAQAIELAGPGSQSPEGLAVRASLAVVYTSLGRMEDAEQAARAALDGYAVTLGEKHPQTLTARNNLAGLLIRAERYEEAERLCRDVLESRLRTLGAGHVDTQLSRVSLGWVLVLTSRRDEAIELLEPAQAALLERLGPDHAYAAFATRMLERARSLESGP